MNMKVLTIREPWASLIGERIKIIETRSWPTKYRGELYIHAGLAAIPRNDTRMAVLLPKLKKGLHFGTIFLKCTLSDCVLITEEYANQVKEQSPLNYQCGNYTAGRYAWILTDVEYIEPISAKGHLSIWNFNVQEN